MNNGKLFNDGKHAVGVDAMYDAYLDGRESTFAYYFVYDLDLEADREVLHSEKEYKNFEDAVEAAKKYIELKY